VEDAVPKPDALPDDLDFDQLIRTISADAIPALTSVLHSAGPLYPWPDLVPPLVARLLELLRTATEPTPADLGDVVDAVRRCARDWVPLQELELCCQTLMTCVFRRLWQQARLQVSPNLLRVSARAAATLPTVLRAIRSAYIEEMGRMAGGRRAKELVIDALLSGGDAVAVAFEAGVSIPEPCVIVSIAPSAGQGEAATASFGEVPAEVRSLLPGGALCAATRDRTRLLALLPTPASGDLEVEPRVRTVAARLAIACGQVCDQACGGGFVAGMAEAVSSCDAGTAAKEAIATADLLARTGAAPGWSGFMLDAVVEVMLAARPDVRQRLATRLAAVRARDPLWATLRALYRCDLDRGRTARWLGIHRSTLDYRLSCVERLTDISPTSVRGIRLFSAGLVADALGH
jgi:hypothetical protein